MSTSLSDILTAAKNVVTAINGLVTTYLGLQGVQVANGITAPTVITTKAGRLIRISNVVDVGSNAPGFAYDSVSTSVTTSPICAMLSNEGVYEINIPFMNGLMVVPGPGQTVTVVYTTGSPVGFTGG